MPDGRLGTEQVSGTDGVTARVVPAKVRVPVTAALPRERLETRLRGAWGHRLTLVVAPAGSGKTTLVARLATTAGVPAGWYRAEAWDTDAVSFLRHVEAALATALPALPRDWQTVEDAARALEALDPGRALLVIDDAHALEGTAAEATLGRLVDYAPPWLAIVVASRVAPSINLSRLRVSGELLEIGPDDLRFRAWEVEDLFRDVYRDPVPPADLADLARRVEGWAAGLQLFHLATRGMPVEERRRVLETAGSSGRLTREYLARNVLFGLPADLRAFLLDTCVLGRLTGPLCDEVRGVGGSATMLEELARRGVFTVPVEDADDAWRYHEVLRAHLDRMLVEEIGEAAARERHARAGEILEAADEPSAALRAYCRAEHWPAVRRLLGRQGEHLAAAAGGAWVDAIPPAIERHDPWVALARARRARNDGRWAEAVGAYARAEAGFGVSPAADAPRRERVALAAWLDPSLIPPPDASGILRTGLVREPAVAAREVGRLPEPAGQVARGLLALAAGDVALARRVLTAAAQSGEGGPVLAAGAKLGSLVAAVLSGERAEAGAFDAVVEAAERAGAGWLATLARELGRWLAAGTLAEGGRAPSPDELEPWTAALVTLAAAWSPASAGAEDAIEVAERRLAAAESAATAFRELGAAVPEAWARSLAALFGAEAGAPDARDAALAAEGLGRLAGVPGARMVAYAALERAVGDEEAGPGRRSDYGLLAETIATETGLAAPPPSLPRARADRITVERASTVHRDAAAPAHARASATRPGAGGTGIVVRTLGGFALEIDGRRVALDGAKPRVRMLLRLLAMHGGVPVHREAIQDALWPDADAVAGARSLHVAISAVRRLLDEVAQPLGGQLVLREGDAYRLALPPDAFDVAAVSRALAAGRAALARGEDPTRAFDEVLERYGGDLLPEDGPADWVVERREHYRAALVEAATGLAEQALLRDDFAAAARACRAGLETDRYQDGLWRMLIEARERAGDPGAASRDRNEYRRVLETLGVPEVRTVSPS